MFRIALLALMGFAEYAHAEPEPASVDAKPDVVWTTKATESTRFLDAETVGPMFEAEERLQVLAVVGTNYRVQLGDQIGWVPAEAVTTDQPEVNIDLEALKNLRTSPSGFLGR